MMSGTSADGVDVVAVELSGCGIKTECRTIASGSFEYGNGLLEKIKNAMKPTALLRETSSLDFELGDFYGRCADDFVRSHELEGRIDCVASHGQTVYHHPIADDGFACTLQIGDGDLIAARTGLVTVSDFRIKDMAFGGEGAPLVPHADYILYSREDESIALNNLGGISNVTYIPKGGDESDVVAFDTGPANALTDLLVQRHFGLPFDRNGEISSKGRIDERLLGLLSEKEMPYLERSLPKSTGKEIYNEDYLSDLIDGISPYDAVRTVVEFTARTIWEAYRRFVIPKGLDRIILTGGGSMNPTLVEAVRRRFDLPVEIAEDWKWREAKAFAVLANELFCGNSANNPGVTGASSGTILGKISLP